MPHSRFKTCALFSYFAIAAVMLSDSSVARVVAAETDKKAQRTNVVFFLADDLGWTGLNCFGSDFYETPNLDRLAQQGMKFTNAYAACTVCSPTRASIMTGMYPARLRLTDFIAGQNRPFAKLRIPNWTKRLEHRHVTVTEALGSAGYETIQVGKWHLNGPGEKNGNPVDHGFSRQILKPAGTRGYFLKQGGGYLTDHLTDRAIEAIDEVRDKPFFLYFAYHVPHTPIQGRADLVDRFRKKADPKATHKNPTYAAMVKSLDMSVGRVLDRLEHHGIADRTLVIFTSDNGGLTQRNGKHDGFTENLPLRRGKGSAYEGGVRVPTIVRWPGVTKPGSVCDTPIMTIDYYPTLLEVTGASGTADHNANVDGQSLVPLLKQPEVELDRSLYWHYPHYHAGGDGPYSAIRSGNWRLVEFHEDNRLELFNLENDIGEKRNLSAEHKPKTAELSAKLARWMKGVDAQMPSANPKFDPDKAANVGRQFRRNRNST